MEVSLPPLSILKLPPRTTLTPPKPLTPTLMPPTPKLTPLLPPPLPHLHLFTLHLQSSHLCLVNSMLGMNLATPNMVILTSMFPNTKLVTLLVKNQEVTNKLTPLANSKLSPMSPMNWDSELLIQDCPLLPFITLSSLSLPFMNTPSPLLPSTNTPSLLLLFTMVLHPQLLRKLLRSSQLKLNILLPLQSLQAGKKRESDPMIQGYGYNSPWLLNTMYQRTMYNGIYAANHYGMVGYNTPRFNYGFYY